MQSKIFVEKSSPILIR